MRPAEEEFEVFVAEVEPRLRRALIASMGFQSGREATADALSWAWVNWGRISKVEHKIRYLYRVGVSSQRRRKVPPTFDRDAYGEPVVEPALAPALAALTERQRVAVLLVHGFGWTLKEVAELTGTRISTVQTHLDRGLARLRAALEVPHHA